jgi:hypothetical protein
MLWIALCSDWDNLSLPSCACAVFISLFVMTPWEGLVCDVYRALLGPIDALIKDKPNLIIVPSGALGDGHGLLAGRCDRIYWMRLVLA